jgi:hypothetical protein
VLILLSGKNKVSYNITPVNDLLRKCSYDNERPQTLATGTGVKDHNVLTRMKCQLEVIEWVKGTIAKDPRHPVVFWFI